MWHAKYEVQELGTCANRQSQSMENCSDREDRTQEFVDFEMQKRGLGRSRCRSYRFDALVSQTQVSSFMVLRDVPTVASPEVLTQRQRSLTFESDDPRFGFFAIFWPPFFSRLAGLRLPSPSRVGLPGFCELVMQAFWIAASVKSNEYSRYRYVNRLVISLFGTSTEHLSPSESLAICECNGSIGDSRV